MKKAVILLTLGIFALPRAGWERVTDYNGYIDLNSVSFPNAQYGWVTGTEQYNASGNNNKRNYMAYTHDGGTTWTPIPDAPSSGAVCFVDANKGFTFRPEQYYGKTIMTVDGGLTWEELSGIGFDVSPKKIFFPSPDTGYVYTSTDVFRTIDGGANWSQCMFASSINVDGNSLMCASFINPHIGWLVSRARISNTSRYTGMIYSTIDGGEKWKRDTVYTVNSEKKMLPGLRSVGFISESIGYIGGDSGFFARTTNGGETWDLRSFDATYGAIKKILFVNNTAGWILADNKLAMTLDGGNTWAEVTITGANIKTSTDMFFSDANHGWIVGGGNLICRTTDNGGHPQPVSVNPSARVRRQPSSAFGIRQLPNRGGRARIAYRLSADAALSLAVYDLKGVKTAFAPKRGQSAGEHEFSFKAPKGFYIMEARIHTKTGELKFAERILVR